AGVRGLRGVGMSRGHEAVEVGGRGIAEELLRRRDAAWLREVVVLHLNVNHITNDRVDRWEGSKFQSFQGAPEGGRARPHRVPAGCQTGGVEDPTRLLTHDASEHGNLPWCRVAETTPKTIFGAMLPLQCSAIAKLCQPACIQRWLARVGPAGTPLQR